MCQSTHTPIATGTLKNSCRFIAAGLQLGCSLQVHAMTQQKLVRLDRGLHYEAKIYATKRQTSLKELTETALAEYMQRNPDPGQAA